MLLGSVRGGFTLVELGVVRIVTGVTCTVALPRLRDTLGSHRGRAIRADPSLALRVASGGETAQPFGAPLHLTG
jgi:hypothetical protein